ncbi:ERMES complex subunit mmm1 [Coemansia sp. RSA 562]|nr:ERMES complex subunit mmm1 [Coemansia sp. RSA 1824]KAJ2149718.1 ERMES complex subunit mmm1 [Coemansia sp. RSA 637]KAJ2168528.1 ERMES complex subunit mmm1 [Coemansia sp. RSA 562]KAJ2715230.1 ERMES complex subunit mmm1 [Coemansia sp. D1744]
METVVKSLATTVVPTLPALSSATHVTQLPAASLSAVAEAAIDIHELTVGWLTQYLPAWQPTFMQGFILGQVSMLVLLVMAIKYILFEEPFGTRTADEELSTTPNTVADSDSTEQKGTVVHEGGFGLSKFMIFTRKPKDPPPSDLAEELAKMHKEVLARTGYDLVGRGPESCDWLTVFLAQIIAKFRTDAERHDRLVRVISEALNGELRPSVIDNIRITQFSLGSDFLRITSARMVPSSGSLGMRVEMDLALHDEITLGFDTRVLVNWPRATVAALPVSMVVSLVKFVGTAAIEFDCESLEPSLEVSILPDYVLEFDVQTLIGSKAKVQNLPMLTSVIIRKLQAAFAKELVRPNGKRIKIKHPFTPKPATPAAGAANAPNAQPANAPHSPVPEINRPLSPAGPPVAELPPNYNTQLPPPHPLRSTANSRAAATGNLSVSPMMGHPPRMFTPDEPITPTSRSTHVVSSLLPPQRPWSPQSPLFSVSPRLRPIIGVTAASTLGPNFANSRVSSTGPYLAGSYVQSPVLPEHGQPASKVDSSDELQVKDSVRQRVNRVIKTVNES